MYQNRPGAILTELQVLPPSSATTTTTKATDICKSCRVQLHAPKRSLTHSSLAGNFLCRSTTKDAWLQSGVCTPVIKGGIEIIFRFKLFSMYHTECVRIIRISLRKAHTHIWSSRCLKWADGEHVGPFRTPGLGRPFKQNVCLLEKKKREEAELPPGGYVPLSARWGTARGLAGRREIPKVTS